MQDRQIEEKHQGVEFGEASMKSEIDAGDHKAFDPEREVQKMQF